MTFDLDRFSLTELDTLIAAATLRKKAVAKRLPIAVVRAELTAIVSSWGYTIDEVLGPTPSPAASPASDTRAKHKGSKVPAKYRDPENKRNTWSGRGRMPRWLAERVKRGHAAADFLIPGLARPTAKKNAVGQRSVFKSK